MKRLNIVQIGGVGHYEYALPTAKKYELAFSAASFPHADDAPERTLNHLAKYGFSPIVYEDWEEMLEAEKPDLVIVNTVMGWNGAIAEKALSMGISVFLEKPFATTPEGLASLEQTYKKAKEKDPTVQLCGMFGIDYLPHFETAYRYVKSGALGDIRLATAQKSYRLGIREGFYSDRSLYGGTIPWVGIHAIEWLIRIAGLRPTAVTALASTEYNGGNGTMEVSALGLFDCEGGRMASVSADVMRPKQAPTHDDDRLRIVGSRGVLEVRQRQCFVIDEEGERALPLVQMETELFEEMILAMEGKGVCRVSAEDGFSATRAALAARESADSGKTVMIG